MVFIAKENDYFCNRFVSCHFLNKWLPLHRLPHLWFCFFFSLHPFNLVFMSGVFTLGFLSFSLSLFTSFSDGQSKAQIEEFRQKLRDMKGMLQKIRQSDDQEKSKDMTYVSVADAETFFPFLFMSLFPFTSLSSLRHHQSVQVLSHSFRIQCPNGLHSSCVNDLICFSLSCFLSISLSKFGQGSLPLHDLSMQPTHYSLKMGIERRAFVSLCPRERLPVSSLFHFFVENDNQVPLSRLRYTFSPLVSCFTFGTLS